MTLFEIAAVFLLMVLALAFANLCTYMILYILVGYFGERKSNPARKLSNKDIEKISLCFIGFMAALGWGILFLKILLGW